MRRKFISLIVSACLMLSAGVTAYAAPPCDDPEGLADVLHTFGLFNGTSTDSNGKPIYSLNQTLTRQEAIVMLVKLLGKESEAKSGSWQHPFTDVESWADPFIGYAYENQLTSGVGADRFGSSEPITAQQYITFLLKALGYSDTQGDFSYNNALSFADSIKLTAGKYALHSSFLRGDAVWLSSAALLQRLKGAEDERLLQRLVNDGAVTEAQYNKGLSDMEMVALKYDYRTVSFIPIADQVDVSKLYEVAGTGKNAGYLRIMGYPGDQDMGVFYKANINGSVVSKTYYVDDFKNGKETIKWSYNGVTYKTTREQCYAFFNDTASFQSYYHLSNGILSPSWFKKVFGNVYEDWIRRGVAQGSSQTLVDHYVSIKKVGTTYDARKKGFTPEAYFQMTHYTMITSDSWISMSQLQKLEPDVKFGPAGNDFAYQLYVDDDEYGYVTVYLLDEITPEFLYSETAAGTFNGIRIKIQQGTMYFNRADLNDKTGI